jgi:uncharacterized membrane protein
MTVSSANDDRFVRKAAVIAACAGLSFVLTIIIRIPIPATDGYFNIGDSVVMFSALTFGPRAGLLVGALGPSMADAIGFPQFIFATAVVKGAEGLIIGLIGGDIKRAGERTIFVALAAGISTMVGGYFLFEALIYPWLARYLPFFGVTDPTAAMFEVLPNIVQGVVSAVIAFAAWKIARRAAAALNAA